MSSRPPTSVDHSPYSSRSFLISVINVDRSMAMLLLHPLGRFLQLLDPAVLGGAVVFQGPELVLGIQAQLALGDEVHLGILGLLAHLPRLVGHDLTGGIIGHLQHGLEDFLGGPRTFRLRAIAALDLALGAEAAELLDANRERGPDPVGLEASGAVADELRLAILDHYPGLVKLLAPGHENPIRRLFLRLAELVDQRLHTALRQ